MRRPSRLLSVFGLSVLVSCAVVGSSEPPGSPRIEQLGGHQWTITTKSPEAQRWFNQGIELIYAFDHADAGRAFNAALEADPTCAMCAWGAAYASGPNINYSNPTDRKLSERWQAMAEKLATSANPPLTPLEQAVIRAASGRYVTLSKRDAEVEKVTAPVCGASSKEPAPSFDVDYAARMDAVFREFGSHPDVATLNADAHMLVDAWYWWSKSGKPTAATEKAVSSLESILKTHPQHAGANHLLIHVLEQSPTPERATKSADLLRTLAPGAPHLLHMPSHIYIKTGRFIDATVANQRALAADDKREEIVSMQGFKPKPSWRVHHLHFLQYAAMMQGKSEVSIDASRKLAARFAGSDNSYAQYMRSLPILNQARFAKWDDVLATPLPKNKNGIEEASVRYAQGLAYVSRGEVTQAKSSIDALRRMAAMDANVKDKIYGEDTAASLMTLLADGLEGTLHLKQKNVDAGLTLLNSAVKKEMAIDADDPPLLGVQMRGLLARGLLENGRFAEAERVAREDLQAVRGSGWALANLHEALVAQKKTAEADEVQMRLKEAWNDADEQMKMLGSARRF
jgi:tetratricopeptide (TPR) repeat protein